MARTKTAPTTTVLTDRSQELLLALWNDADNWSGTPLLGGNVGGSKEDRGNITDLKKLGLITTFTDKNPTTKKTDTWVSFTEEGESLCKSLTEVPPTRPAKKSKKSKAKDTDPRTEEIATAWRNGSSLAQLKQKYSMSRSNLRRLITTAVGGKDKFAQFRKEGAGGSRAKTMKREKVGRAGPQTGDDFFTCNLNDANVPVITSAKMSEGWKYTRIRGVSIHTSPEGISYVQARPNENCDLIYHFDENHRSAGLPDVRLRKYEDSSKGRKVKQVIQKEEAIAEATEQRTTRKRTARVARKTRKARA